jgi:hypothetical protein
MEIKRAETQASGKGPSDWFTGTVRIDPLFPVRDPARSARETAIPAIVPVSYVMTVPKVETT